MQLKHISFIFTIITIFSCYLSSLCMELSAEAEKKIFEEMYNIHSRSLVGTKTDHKPLCICFSGIPGMGKTHISKLLEERYQAIRLNNDELRELMKSVGASENSTFSRIYGYIKFFMNHYKGNNKLFVLDASLDRRYQEIFPLLMKHDIQYVIIRLEASDELVIERIKERDNASGFIQHYDRMKSDYIAFGSLKYPMYILNNEDSSAHDELFKYIDQLLFSLT